MGQPDDAHAAAADLLLQQVAAGQDAGLRIHAGNVRREQSVAGLLRVALLLQVGHLLVGRLLEGDVAGLGFVVGLRCRHVDTVHPRSRPRRARVRGMPLFSFEGRSPRVHPTPGSPPPRRSSAT